MMGGVVFRCSKSLPNERDEKEMIKFFHQSSTVFSSTVNFPGKYRELGKDKRLSGAVFFLTGSERGRRIVSRSFVYVFFAFR